MKIWKRHLMLRLVSYYLLLSLATAALVGYITYYHTREIVQQSVFERLTAVANLKEDDLKRWVNEQRRDVLFLAHLPEFDHQARQLLWLDQNAQNRNTTEHQAAYNFLDAYLQLTVDHKASFGEIALLNIQGGRVVISTEKEHEGQFRFQDTYFREGQEATFIQNSYISPYSGELTITVATPIREPNGPALGVLAVHLNLDQMDHIILERSGLGQSGEVYLVDRHNLVIAGERFNLEEFPRGVHTPGIRAALQGQHSRALYNNYEGTPVIGDYRWIDELQLALLTEMQQAEAFAPAYHLAWTIVLVGLASALLFAGGVSLLAYRLTQRITALTGTAVQVAQGDLTPVAPDAGSDEIAALGQAFNIMTARLRQLYTSQEQKVSELEEVKSALQQYAYRLEAQRDVGRAILAAQSPLETATAALSQLQHMVPCQRASVIIWEARQGEATLLASVGRQLAGFEDGTAIPLDSLEQFLNQTDRHIEVIPDVRLMQPRTTMAEQLLAHGILTFLSVALVSDERFMGLLNVGADTPDIFTAEHLEITCEVADQLAVAIRQSQLFTTVQQQFAEKVTLFEKAQQEIRERQRAERALQEAHDELERRITERTAELTLLNRAGQTLISTLDLDQILRTVLEELRNLLNVVACSVWLVDSGSGELVCRQSSGPRSNEVRGWRIPIGTGIVGAVAQSGRSLLIHDVAGDKRHQSALAQSINLEPRSLLTAPLIVQGRVIGCLQALDIEVGRFGESDLALVESLGATAAFAIENARLYKQARQDAETQSILLHEVNHRVKNNLSAIIGLLYAERRHAPLKDQVAYQKIMQDLINRVQGLATVHSLLSLSAWAPISLTELITRVTYSSLRPLPADQRLFVQVTPSPVLVTADQANHLALIINELVTNSIKYGLAGRLIGHIDITIRARGEDISLEFRDDGPGFPADVLREKEPRYNVGFHLIANLVRVALNGKLFLSNLTNEAGEGSGARVVIQFKSTPAPVVRGT